MRRPRPCRLVIFDLDGTLLNTIDDLASACNHALSVHGFPLYSAEQYKLFVGNGVQELIRQAIPEKNRDTPTLIQVQKEYSRYYGLYYKRSTQPYDGIMEMLQEIRTSGIPIAVVSNKPHEYVPDMIDYFFPRLINYSMGMRDEFPAKPDPSAVQHILSRFKCDHQNCVFVGDTDTDMLTGKNANVYTVGVSWGFRTRNELLSHGANVVIDKPQELTSLLVDRIT